MSLTPILTFSGRNIDDLHRRACSAIFANGKDIVFGDINHRKQAREIDGTFQIYGSGLRDVLKGKTPKGFLWAGEKVKVFQEQFIDSQLNPYNFDYTYPEQLRAFSKGEEERFNQLEMTKKGLAEDMSGEVFNNRRVGVLYHPRLHNMRDLPCFNWYQCRYNGENKVSLRLLFRSHDWGTADWANFSSVGYCFDELVFKPIGLELEELICHSTSAHIYASDAPQIAKMLNTSWDRFKAVFGQGRGQLDIRSWDSCLA